MIVYLDGKFVPEAEALIPVSDRAFLLGDGLFETVLVQGGRPVLWEHHWSRLFQGANFLRLKLLPDDTWLRAAIRELIARNQLPSAILRITVSRGSGGRGYSLRGADQPRIVMTLHPPTLVPGATAPPWRLVTSSLRVPTGAALAGCKTLNKLPNILARAEAEAAGADEALLLNTDGDVAEAAAANVFWITDDSVCTPALASGVLGGITRYVVLNLCRALQIPAGEARSTPEQLRACDGVFLTLSTLGIVEATALDGRPLRRSPLVPALQDAYQRLLAAAASADPSDFTVSAPPPKNHPFIR